MIEHIKVIIAGSVISKGLHYVKDRGHIKNGVVVERHPLELICMITKSFDMYFVIYILYSGFMVLRPMFIKLLELLILSY